MEPDTNREVASIRIDATLREYRRMLSWASQWPQRRWEQCLMWMTWRGCTLPLNESLKQAGAPTPVGKVRPPAHRPRHRPAVPVLLDDPGAVVSQDAEGHRDAAVAVLARPVLGGLRAGAGSVPRLHRGAVAVGDHQADRDLEGRAACLSQRDLSGVDYVYLWADGIHVTVRLEEHKLCLLVMIGVRADGRKELVALADGYRESTESWADLLRDCSGAGCALQCWPSGRRARVLGRAARGVSRDRVQRCWFHKIEKVLEALPKSAHPGALEAAGLARGGHRGDEDWRGRAPRHSNGPIVSSDIASIRTRGSSDAGLTKVIGDRVKIFDGKTASGLLQHLADIPEVVVSPEL